MQNLSSLNLCEQNFKKFKLLNKKSVKTITNKYKTFQTNIKIFNFSSELAE